MIDPDCDANATHMILDPAAFSLMLREGTRTDGVGDIDEATMMGAVELNTAGAGEVIYNIVLRRLSRVLMWPR